MSPVRKPSALGALNAAATHPARDTLRDAPAPADPTRRRPRPEKPVRFTLDLDRPHHAFLKSYAQEIEAKGASEVMRALLDELQADPELAARVRARVWGGAS